MTSHPPPPPPPPRSKSKGGEHHVIDRTGSVRETGGGGGGGAGLGRPSGAVRREWSPVFAVARMDRTVRLSTTRPLSLVAHAAPGATVTETAADRCGPLASTLSLTPPVVRARRLRGHAVRVHAISF
ncbi:unnamed protein product, partial [Iphiclides podalirius]